MSYPVDQNAVQLHMQHPQAQTQWVDSPGPSPPPQPPVEQDMLFQWVDAPSHGRPAAHQQPYLQAPPVAPPYFPGVDQHHGHLGPHHGVGFDPRFAAAQGMDPYGRYGGAFQGAVGHQFFDQSGGRRIQGGHQGTQRGGRSRQTVDDSKGRSRQPASGNRQGAAVDSSASGGGQRRGQEPSAEAQTAAVLESMGTEGLRSTLVSILESLYADRIKPMANYVRGRLKERSTPEPMVKSFVDLYSQHPDLFVVQPPAQGSQTDEATVFFVKDKEPEWFKGWVDIDSPDDPYPEATWGELAKFLDGEHTFAGGRYGMARELMQRNLPFLLSLSLGEVCHMVQLSIQHRRLIVYHRKMLKPIQTVLSQQTPPANDTAATAGGEEIKDMDDLCLVLLRMLSHHPQGIRLCRMKQMIKHELCRELSEMAFQCTKLIELLNQEPLSTTFVLDTENDGKSIYVRLGDPDKFSDHVKHIYQQAKSIEAKQVVPVGQGVRASLR